MSRVYYFPHVPFVSGRFHEVGATIRQCHIVRIVPLVFPLQAKVAIHRHKESVLVSVAKWGNREHQIKCTLSRVRLYRSEGSAPCNVSLEMLWPGSGHAGQRTASELGRRWANTESIPCACPVRRTTVRCLHTRTMRRNSR